MPKLKHIRCRDRGFALLGALIILVSLSLLAVTMSHRVTVNEMMAANQRDMINAMAVAETFILGGST